MLNLKDIESIILENKDTLINVYHINHIGVFGSFVKDETHEKSDINFFIKVNKDLKASLLLRAKLKVFLEELFERECQIIVDREHLTPSSIDAKTESYEIF